MKASILLLPMVLLVTTSAFAKSKTLLDCYGKDSASGNSVTITEENGAVEIKTDSWDGTVNNEPIITDESERPNGKENENKYYLAGATDTVNKAVIDFGSVRTKGKTIWLSLGDPDKTVIQFKLETLKSEDDSSSGENYRLVVTSNNSKHLAEVLATASLAAKSTYGSCQ